MKQQKKSQEWIVLLIVSLSLSFLGTVPDADQISIWIVHFVESLPFEDFYKPYQ